MQHNDAGQYLSFTLNEEAYGVDILRVQEIRGWEEVRALPNTPDYIKGVLDLRGVVVPIVDLRVRFNMSDVEYSTTTVIIVLSVQSEAGDQQVVGAVVDGVSDVLDIMEENIKPAPKIGVSINNRYLSGMVSLDDRMVILLDIDRLFDASELNALTELND